MQIEVDKSRNKALIKTKPTAAVMAALPSLEGRRSWLKGGGLQIEPTGRNLETLRLLFPLATFVEVGHSATELASGVASQFEGYTSTYETLTMPLEHQIRASKKALPVLLSGRGFGLFMEQGTGKTKTTIDLAGELHARGLIDAVLVMAKKGVHRQWIESEIPTHLGCDWSGAFWPTRNGVVPDELLDPGRLKFFTINWDGAKTDKGRRACLEFVTAHKGRVMIVGDETQEIKNARSARFKVANEIAKAAGSNKRMIALTGTPVAKDLTDEWAQLKWVDEDILGIRYISAFRNEYCIMGGFEGKVVVGQKNMDRFRAKVDPFTFRATKDELGILPKVYRPWRFDLLPQQRKVIQELRKTLESQIDSGEIVSAANAAVAMTKIQQASNGFVVDENGSAINLVPAAKNPRIVALLEILSAYEGPAIVWARFRQDIKNISDALDEAGVSYVQYHGGTPDKERADNVQRFLSGGARIFLSNPQAGGTGLNLQKGGCTHAIYYSNSYNAIDRWQSEDRIHRIGTVGTCVYTDLVAKGSIDAAILNNLKRKQGLADLALGDIRKILEEL